MLLPNLDQREGSNTPEKEKKKVFLLSREKVVRVRVIPVTVSAVIVPLPTSISSNFISKATVSLQKHKARNREDTLARQRAQAQRYIRGNKCTHRKANTTLTNS